MIRVLQTLQQIQPASLEAVVNVVRRKRVGELAVIGEITGGTLLGREQQRGQALLRIVSVIEFAVHPGKHLVQSLRGLAYCHAAEQEGFDHVARFTELILGEFVLVHQRVQAHQKRARRPYSQGVDSVKPAFEIGVWLLPKEHAGVSCRIRKQFGQDGLRLAVKVPALHVILEIVIGVLLFGCALGNLQIQPIPEEHIEFIFGILAE